jgi:hypothetical protein
MPSKLRQRLFGIVALSAFLFASVIASHAESININYGARYKYASPWVKGGKFQRLVFLCLIILDMENR